MSAKSRIELVVSHCTQVGLLRRLEAQCLIVLVNEVGMRDCKADFFGQLEKRIGRTGLETLRAMNFKRENSSDD